MTIQKEELEEGVEGQKLFCEPHPDNFRFYKCKLDGEKIAIPTDSFNVETDEKIRVGRNIFGVNPSTSFFDKEPRIRVECGFRTESADHDIDEFCVYDIKDVEGGVDNL